MADSSTTRSRLRRLAGPMAAIVLLAVVVVLVVAQRGSPGSSSTPGATGGQGGSLSVGSSSGRGAGAAPVGAGAVNRGGRARTGTGSGRTGSGSGSSGSNGASGSGASGSTADGTASGNAASVAAAQQALSTYLQAIVHHDGAAAQRSSDAGALGVAGVVIDVASIDAGRGATTTVTLGPDTLAPTSSSSSSVTFGGSVPITTSISGPKGSAQYTDTLSGPVTVADEAGTWKVTDFDYDGQAIAIWPEKANETVNGLHLTVGYVVSFGNLTAALIGIGAESGNVDVQLQSTTLTAGTVDNGVGDFTSPPQPTGVLRFTRTGTKPTQLTVDFSTSSGQQDDFSLTLS